MFLKSTGLETNFNFTGQNKFFTSPVADICYGNVNKKFSQTNNYKVFLSLILTEPPSKVWNWGGQKNAVFQNSDSRFS